jgi:hypothetical protein
MATAPWEALKRRNWVAAPQPANPAEMATRRAAPSIGTERPLPATSSPERVPATGTPYRPVSQEATSSAGVGVGQQQRPGPAQGMAPAANALQRQPAAAAGGGAAYLDRMSAQAQIIAEQAAPAPAPAPMPPPPQATPAAPPVPPPAQVAEPAAVEAGVTNMGQGGKPVGVPMDQYTHGQLMQRVFGDPSSPYYGASLVGARPDQPGGQGLLTDPASPFYGLTVEQFYAHPEIRALTAPVQVTEPVATGVVGRTEVGPRGSDEQLMEEVRMKDPYTGTFLEEIGQGHWESVTGAADSRRAAALQEARNRAAAAGLQPGTAAYERMMQMATATSNQDYQQSANQGAGAIAGLKERGFTEALADARTERTRDWQKEDEAAGRASKTVDEYRQRASGTPGDEILLRIQAENPTASDEQLLGLFREEILRNPDAFRQRTDYEKARDMEVQTMVDTIGTVSPQEYVRMMRDNPGLLSGTMLAEAEAAAAAGDVRKLAEIAVTANKLLEMKTAWTAASTEQTQMEAIALSNAVMKGEKALGDLSQDELRSLVYSGGYNQLVDMKLVPDMADMPRHGGEADSAGGSTRQLIDWLKDQGVTTTETKYGSANSDFTKGGPGSSRDYVDKTLNSPYWVNHDGAPVQLKKTRTIYVDNWGMDNEWQTYAEVYNPLTDSTEWVHLFTKQED